jgi:flagellar hook-length control protein FliK
MESVDAGTAQPLFRDTQTVPVKVGETPVADTTQPDLDDQLAKQIGTTLEEGTQQVKLQLTPESLGTLTIDLTRTQDGALQVVLHTTTEKAANLLNQHAENLSALLQNSTQNTVQIEVQRQDQNQQFQQQFQQQNQQHGNSQQHSRRQQSGEDFLQQLRLGLVTLDEQVS